MKNKVIVVLDNIRSMYNVGAIMRAMDCVGGDSIYLCGITSTPNLLPGSKKIKKTALASYDDIKWTYFSKTVDAIMKLKTNGYKVYIVEQDKNSKIINKVQFKFPCGFVFGHEIEGVNKDLYKFADEIVCLLNKGKSKSWNVSSAASIVLWEAWKQCGG